MSFLRFCLPVLILLHYTNASAQPFDSLMLQDLAGKKVSMGELLTNTKAMAVVFLNDECPICRFYAPEIARLDTFCSIQDIGFISVFSGMYSKKQIRRFTKKYKITIPVFQDPDFSFARAVGASVTPEIVLLHTDADAVLYKGKIDDAFVSLGVRKTSSLNHFFTDAVMEFISGKPISKPATQAVGCMMNY